MREWNERHAGPALVERARELFDQSVSGLDAETRSRLNRGRQRALAEIGRGRPSWVRWTMAFGAAAAAGVAVLLFAGSPTLDDIASPSNAADLEILLDEESFEMLEDLEFYSWIELAETEGSDGPENHVG